MDQQELIMKLSMFEQQIQQIQQQLQAVEQALAELNSLNLGLDELIGKTDFLIIFIRYKVKWQLLIGKTT